MNIEERKNRNISKQFVLLIYTVVFYGIWILWEGWGKRFVSNTVENEVLSQFIKSGIVKNLVWTVPAGCLVHYFKDDVYVKLKDMFKSRVNILKYLPVYLIFTVYLLVGAIFTKGNIEVSETFRFSDLIIVLFVGITEEMVFRGWLLNITLNEKKKWLPVIVNALMFLAIHFPVWIASGQFVDIFVSFSFLSVIILSIIFSWTFIKSKNICIPITLHMYWDLLMFLFY